jgi:hypothetical protein
VPRKEREEVPQFREMQVCEWKDSQVLPQSLKQKAKKARDKKAINEKNNIKTAIYILLLLKWIWISRITTKV